MVTVQADVVDLEDGRLSRNEGWSELSQLVSLDSSRLNVDFDRTISYLYDRDIF